MEESAQNLGAHGFTLFRRIVFPLALPGYVAGAALVFVKVFDDLATPLLLNVTNMLAPQAYLKITSVGITDPMGYVISVIMIFCSLGAMALSALRAAWPRLRHPAARRRRAVAPRRSDAPAARRRPHSSCWCWRWCSRRTSASSCCRSRPCGRTRCCRTAITLAHYVTVFREAGSLISNTILYCGLAGLIDVVLGRDARLCRAAHPAARPAAGRAGRDVGGGGARPRARHRAAAHLLRRASCRSSGESLATFWFMLVIAYAVRRLPYALSAATPRLQQLHVSLEEAAENLGAGKFATLTRIVVPLMTGGLLAGFVTSFATAAVELSATLLLVARSSRRAALLRHLCLHAVGRRTRAGRGARS